MVAQYCFVKILTVKLAQFSGGVYKEVFAVEETGRWLNKFSFNVFADNPQLFDLMVKGAELSIKVLTPSF